MCDRIHRSFILSIIYENYNDFRFLIIVYLSNSSLTYNKISLRIICSYQEITIKINERIKIIFIIKNFAYFCDDISTVEKFISFPPLLRNRNGCTITKLNCNAQKVSF